MRASFLHDTQVGLLHMVRALLLPLVVVVTALMSVACGDFSQEDLVFRAALPSKSEVAVVPPGVSANANADVVTRTFAGTNTTTQAIDATCGRDDLRCHAQQLATGVNTVSGALLDLVDRITALPPTTRAPGKRIWGPVHLSDGDVSVRFEMTLQDDGATYAFCLHGRAGNFDASTIDHIACHAAGAAVPLNDISGFTQVLVGTFKPGVVPGEGARTGAGSLTFEAGAVGAIRHDANLQGTLTVDFDHTGGVVDNHVHLANVIVPGTGETHDDDAVFHSDADGSGSFVFSVFLDLVAGGLGNRAELLQVSSRWTAALSGRADASVTGGDAGDVGYHATQCWDAALTPVFTTSPDATSGDATACAFTTSTLP
jgi:hypothetical protein